MNCRRNATTMKKDKTKSTGKNKKGIIIKSLIAAIIVLLAGWIWYGNVSIQTTVYEIPISAE